MKTMLIFIFLFLIPAIVNCQDSYTQQKEQIGMNFSVVTNQEAYFPGGDRQLFDYFLNNIHYSDSDIANRIRGNVMLSFNVMPDSTLTDIVVFKGINNEIDKEIVQLVKHLKYAPGIENGTATKMIVLLTVAVRAE